MFKEALHRGFCSRFWPKVHLLVQDVKNPIDEHIHTHVQTETQTNEHMTSECTVLRIEPHDCGACGFAGENPGPE